MRWLATDAERMDDQGMEMPMDWSVGTQSFTLVAYTLLDLEQGAGDIRVQP
jgi:hypothetical protein